MPMLPNPRVVLAKWPEGLPIPGEHLVYDATRTIDIDTVALGGGFLTKLLQISPEPYMRGRMTNARSYGSQMILGAPVVGQCLVKVIRSEKEGVDVGSYMFGMSHWELYTVQPYLEGRNTKREEWTEETFDMDSLALRPVPDPQGAFPLSRFSSLLGTPGLSGYASFKTMIEPRIDTGGGQKTIFVSAGSGGVGTMVIQLAKMKGMKVIASAGNDAKVAYCEKIGADYAFNYKTETYKEALAKEGPIDFYYDNVGGDALEEAINASKKNAYIVMCGQVSVYNTPVEQRRGIRNLHLMYERRITMQGFLVPDLLTPEMMEHFTRDVTSWIAQGVLQSEEHLVSGMENAAEAFRRLFVSGPNDPVGKVVVVVAER